MEIQVNKGEAYDEFDTNKIGITFKEMFQDPQTWEEMIRDITDLNEFLTPIEDISISDMVRFMIDELNNSENTLTLPADNVQPKIDSVTKANFNITIDENQKLEVTNQFIMNGKLTINTGGEIFVSGANANIENSQPIENSGTIELENHWTIDDVNNKSGGEIDLSLVNKSDYNERTITCESGSKVILPIYIAPDMKNEDDPLTTFKIIDGAIIEHYKYEPTIDEGNIILEDRSSSGYDPSKWGIKFVDEEDSNTTPTYTINNDTLSLSDIITVINDSPYDEPYTLDLSQEGINPSLEWTGNYYCDFNLDLTNMTDLSVLNTGEYVLIMRDLEDLILPKNPDSESKATSFKIQMAEGNVYYHTGEISVGVDDGTKLITVTTDGGTTLLNNAVAVKKETNITIDGDPTFIGTGALTISSLAQTYDSEVNKEENILDLTKTVGLIEPIIDQDHNESNSIKFTIRTTPAMGITIASDIEITEPIKIQLKLAGV